MKTKIIYFILIQFCVSLNASIFGQVDNDICTDAINIPISQGLSCSSSINGTNINAIHEGVVNSPCNSNGEVKDVWYKFTATQELHILFIDTISTSGWTGLDVELYSDCHTLKSCTPPSLSYIFESLIAGDTYYIRIPTEANITFTACITSPVVYDECSEAVEILASTNLSCSSPIQFTFAGAEDPDFVESICSNNCNFFCAHAWFYFDAQSERQVIDFTGIEFFNNISISIFEATECNDIIYENQIYCDNYTKDQLQFWTLNPGQRYYLVLENDYNYYPDIYDLCIYSFPEIDCENNYSSSAIDCSGLPSNPIIKTAEKNFTSGFFGDMDQSEKWLIHSTRSDGTTTVNIYNTFCDNLGLVFTTSRDDAYSSTVAIDGIHAAVGFPIEDQAAIRDGIVITYTWDDEMMLWYESGTILAPEPENNMEFGFEIDIHNDVLAISAKEKDINGMQDAGQVYIYQRQNNAWQLTQTITSPSPSEYEQFGGEISIYGNNLAIGQTYSSIGHANTRVYIYQLEGNLWIHNQTIENCDGHPNDGFGYVIDIDDQNMIITANLHKHTGYSTAGKVYHFQLENSAWRQKNAIVASDWQNSARFGMNADMSNGLILISSPYQGTQSDGNGQAYIFELQDDCVEEVAQIVRDDSEITTFSFFASLHGNFISLAGISEQEFSILSHRPEQTVDNDNCIDAKEVNVSPVDECAQTNYVYFNNATLDQSIITVCPGNILPKADAWYRFTTTAIHHSLRIKNKLTASYFPGLITIYQVPVGQTCQDLDGHYLCELIDMSEEYSLDDHNIGDQYYIRFVSDVDTCDPSLEFCITTSDDPCLSSIHVKGDIDFDVNVYADDEIIIESNIYPPAEYNEYTARNSIELHYPFELETNTEMLLGIGVEECDCSDGIDGDGDGLIDCEDCDCYGTCGLDFGCQFTIHNYEPNQTVTVHAEDLVNLPCGYSASFSQINVDDTIRVYDCNSLGDIDLTVSIYENGMYVDVCFTIITLVDQNGHCN